MSTQIRNLWTLLKRASFSKKIAGIVVLLSVVSTIVGLVIPLLTINLINNFSLGGFSWQTLAIVVTALLMQAVFGGLTYFFMRMLGEELVANLRKLLWQHVLRLPVPFFDQHETGETMSRITQDTSVVKELVTEQLINFITGIFSIVGAIIILMWIDWKMTLLMLISVPLAIGAMLPLGQRIHAITVANQDELARFSGRLGRILANIRLIKSTQAEQSETKFGASHIEALYRFGLREAKILAFLSPIMTLIMMLVLILIFGYGGAQIAAGHLSAGELVAIMIYLVQIILPFTQMATFFSALQKALGATERIQLMLHQHIERSDGQALSGTLQPISFQNVSFQYSENPILRQMSFTLPAGKVSAFVSQSGGGKTTMFSLLERFYTPTAGQIFYGEQDISQFALAEWRALIGYVSQESPLLAGTVRDNLLYGNPHATDEELWAALKAAYALDFVKQLPKQLHTEVGESGIKLSGGQKQRIAIAHAILRNPQILLLDEATSNLDNESEREVQAALTNLIECARTLGTSVVS